MFEQYCADATPLEPVENRERNLCATRIFAANVTPDANEPLASFLSQRGNQSDVILEIEIGQTLQILRRQGAPDPHESKIDGLLTKPLEVLVQALLIVRANRANSYRSAVEHRRIDGIILRVDQHLAISQHRLSSIPCAY